MRGFPNVEATELENLVRVWWEATTVYNVQDKAKSVVVERLVKLTLEPHNYVDCKIHSDLSSPLYSSKAGRYRILFQIKDKEFVLVDIKHRSKSFEKYGGRANRKTRLA